MKLNKITIENFRCFKEYKVEFSPNITVLIGKNGAGKTSLIHAMHKALSFIFTTDSYVGINLLSAGNPDLKVENIPTDEIFFNHKERTYENFVNIHASASLDNTHLEWDIHKPSTSNSMPHPSKYKKAYGLFMDKYEENSKLPVLAYYSDSYPHVHSNISKNAKKVLSSSDPIPRNFGYYQWNDETSCTTIWQTRFLNSIINLTVRQLNNDSPEYNAFQKEISFINKHLKEFSKSEESSEDAMFQVDSLTAEYRGENWILIIRLKNGFEIPFEQLPAGYKRLFSIVFDIAYRSYILNEDKTPEGIVIIDEIDLHLHPSLEQDVLQRLQLTFPKIQFILSTHSALVISNLNTRKTENSILRMDYGQPEPYKIPDIFGVDYNTSMSDFMQTPSRNTKLKELMDDYIVLKIQGYESDAKSVFNKIEKLTGSNSTIIDEINRQVKNNN
jgi:Predicted ATP-binding protein involved in virulence